MTNDEDNKDKADTSHPNSEPEDKENTQVKNIPTMTEPVTKTPDDIDLELMSIPILTNKIEDELDIGTDLDDPESEKP